LPPSKKKAGAFCEALDVARKAIKAAGDNKAINIQVLQFRASLLAQMAGKPTDKKLKEAEEELRQALTVDPANPVTHLDLGMILLRQERDAEGIPELNIYITSPGANPATVAEAKLVIANPIRGRMPFAPNFSFTTIRLSRMPLFEAKWFCSISGVPGARPAVNPFQLSAT
jgi:tetratricopeptide (TPR) repeat protein